MEDSSVFSPEGSVIQTTFSLVRFLERFSRCVSEHKSTCSGGDTAAQQALLVLNFFMGKAEQFYLVSIINEKINVFGSMDSHVENVIRWLKLGK